MKKLAAHILIVLALVATPIVITTGCHKMTVQKKAVSGLFSIGATVDAAYRSYLDLVVTKAVPTNSFPEIARKYRSFQTMFNGAVVLMVNSTNAVAPDSIQIQAEELLNDITKAKK